MSLRVRIAAVASLAVALAVVLAAVSLYLAVRSDLRGQIDQSLSQRGRIFANAVALSPAQRAQRFGTGAPPRAGRPPAGFPPIQPARFGGASGYVQFITPQGKIAVPGGQGSSPTIPLSATDRAIAARGTGRALSDRTVRETHLRVLTVGTRSSGAVLIARPLAEVDHELNRILLILLVVGLAGIAIAALLGTLVARAALGPIARFTRRTESLTGEMDLSQRLEEGGRDELARLARSFNTTLDALEGSVAAQRQLIADASHELRTPIASLRANIQILEDAGRLPPAEQESLRADIIDELDELTALVSDVVELARGASGRPSGGRATDEDVRLDEIVADAVGRARRRGDLRYEVDLEPTIVRGEAEQINRAVSNLLDNARKWSPPAGLVEITLRDGVVIVRDHGPGFEQDDLSQVFDRFYRAKAARTLPGSGLGLAIVRQAAESHQGYARAANAPGGGACLEVSFGPPRKLAEPAEPLGSASGG
ncbi:MAG: two-component system, OmpR family, sensor histidine kinase MprB [Solirubrobacteraceae bacterium]|nr:two-component system, OmpR family, sensor histidine kinase MprB [Solirubrobacteraceae bacterium]